MHAVVVVDSEFGNTYELAEAIATEFRAAGPVEVINVRAPATESRLPTDIDIFVVGGPTQVHGVSRPLAEYLDALPPRFLTDIACAGFDTRLRGWPLVTGAASEGISRRLKKLGGHVVMPPESFLVMGKEGPLVDGERQRAQTWATQFIATMLPLTASVMNS